MLFENIALWYSLLHNFPVKTNKRKVLNTCKELIRKTMAFEYEELLLLKSPQNKVAPNIVITGKKKRKTSQTYHAC